MDYLQPESSPSGGHVHENRQTTPPTDGRVQGKSRAGSDQRTTDDQRTVATTGVHANQISAWKKQLLQNSGEVLEPASENARSDQQQLIDDLLRKIGQHQIELDWLKKNLALSIPTKRSLVMADEGLSIERQCQLLGLARSSYYYQPAAETAYNLELMQLIDQQHLRTPSYGVRMMRDHLRRIGHQVNTKRIRRLFRLMSIEALVPQPNSSQRDPEHTICPYLLRGVEIVNINQVWSTDITYMPMARGFFYLVAVIDWYSRFVLSWRLSNRLETRFCLDALEEALDSYGRPEIFNTDQGAQFTAQRFTDVLKMHQIHISMDGRGRAGDNVFIERLWRSYKYEYLYVHLPEDGRCLYEGTAAYFKHFNFERPHSALNGQSPAQCYRR